jgi:monofunctional biosynthetic peptidoglycan transglycosylase
VRTHPVKRLLRAVLLWAAGLISLFYALAIAELIALRWIDPPTTTVQAQRRIEAWLRHRPYRKQYVFVPLDRISPHLQHAVISAEDGRFYDHHGIDWKEVQQVIDQDVEAGRLGRGASTITQQLVKNLFRTTSRSLVRKGVEFTLAPVAERLLSKQRILELYLNVIEWGPGVYGAEAAARSWYAIPAARIDREQAARLAALIPSPLRRKPARMNGYSGEILRRMAQRSW